MNKLDLDAYNITSDDFRNSDSQNGNPNASQAQSRNRALERRAENRQNVTHAHPRVPILDLTKIFEWRDKSNNDNIIMIRISESRVTGEDRITEEVNDDDGIQNISKQFFERGSRCDTTSDRVTEMFERKQMIINALNQAYADEDEDPSTVSNQDEGYGSDTH
jgi:hypothetical protein